MTLSADICGRRSAGSPESKAAHASADRKRGCERVWELIRQKGLYGATAHEIAAQMGVSVNRISGRFSQLKAAGLIVRVLDGQGQPVRRKTATGCEAGVYRVPTRPEPPRQLQLMVQE